MKDDKIKPEELFTTTIPAGTLRTGTTIKAGDVVRVFASAYPLPVRHPLRPPSRYVALMERRHRIASANAMILAVLETALTIMEAIRGKDAPDVVALRERFEVGKADITPALAKIDADLALLLRPVCSVCGWPWVDAWECAGCGEAQAPAGPSLPTCEAERDALEAGDGDEVARVREHHERLREAGTWTSP